MKTLRRYHRRHPDRTPAGFVHPAIAKLFAARPVLPLVKYDAAFAAWQQRQTHDPRPFAQHFAALRRGNRFEEPLNDPSSATRLAGRNDCKPRRHAGFAAAHG